MAIAPQIKLIDRRRKDTEVFDAVFSGVDDLRKIFYKKIIDAIVEFSPVDTGTYMESHEVQEGRSQRSVTNSSSGKERGQPKEPFASAARARLFAEIDALPPGDSNIFIRNYAIHSRLVEYGGANMPVAYAPYTRARSLTPRFIREAIEEVSL